jgi:hypothetical protein
VSKRECDWYGTELFKSIKGMTFSSIEKIGNYEIKFTEYSGRKFMMSCYDDCRASCTIDEVHGDLSDLVGSPILLAEEVVSRENPEGVTKGYQDSFTWTFYKLATIKGSVTIRWYGESNGYYSESVTFEELK